MKRIAAVVGLAMVVTACGAITGSTAAVGECVDLDVNATSVGELKGFDCSKEHDAEIYERSDISLDGDFDLEAVEALAIDTCIASFREYVGSVIETSSLDVYYLYPEAEGWEEGDREVICAVYTPNADYTEGIRTTGSLKGSGK